MRALWLADRVSKHTVGRETDDYLRHLAHAPREASRQGATKVLTQLRSEPGPHVHLGETLWGEPVVVPLVHLVKACGLTTGGTGAGKTMFALHPIEALIRLLPGLRTMAFGVLDAKGELFERTVYLLARRLAKLDGEEREALARRIVIVDFSSRDAVSPYNILARWPHAEADYFVTSRLETLRELLPAGEKLSLRGAEVLRNILAVLSEFGLPLTYLGTVLSSETFRRKLAGRSRNEEVREYFRQRFAAEGKQTLSALRVRMESLFASDGVRLTLAGSTAPDFQRLQNEGKIVLVNCAGPTITRGVRLLLRGICG